MFLISPNFLDLSPNSISLDGISVMANRNYNNSIQGKAILAYKQLQTTARIHLTGFEY